MAKRKSQNRTKWMRSRGLRVRPTLEILDDRVLLSGTNPIVTENQLPGTPESVWLVPQGQADPALEGYSTDISVDVGQTISFKITDTTLDPYSIDIYRIGYYGGDGARPGHNDLIVADFATEPAGPTPQRHDRRG